MRFVHGTFLQFLFSLFVVPTQSLLSILLVEHALMVTATVVEVNMLRFVS